MFNDKQQQELSRKLDPSKVRRREGKFDYIEGWHALAEANRIFGPHGWDRETVELRVVNEWQTRKGGDAVGYLARVRIVVTTPGGQTIRRDGVGYGSGFGDDRHEGAAKEAETDATKRALATFGWPFGLALYDSTREHVAEPPTSDQRREIASLLRQLGHETREQMADALAGVGVDPASLTADDAAEAIEALRVLVLEDEARTHNG